jgi:plastocyanin
VAELLTYLKGPFAERKLARPFHHLPLLKIIHMKQDRISLLLLAFFSIATSVVLFDCKKSSNTTSSGTTTSGTPGSNEVWIQNMAFNPSSITVSVNTTVKWTNKDNTAHTVTSTTGAFDSGSVGSGGTYSHQFTTTGTYSYKCTIHSNMNGTVVVQ